MRQDLILIRPKITEKSMIQAQSGKFTFIVNLEANKDQIRKIVETQFKVNVINVSTIKIKGKAKRFGKKRSITQLPNYKKAIVELKKGQKIDLFDIKETK